MIIMEGFNPKFMLEAISLSIQNVENGIGGPFGAVVVKDGVIIARGTNLVTSSNDPTAHAEVVAIREACRLIGDFQLTGCDIYTSCEPCPMCLAAIYWARPARVFFANTKEDAAAIQFDDQFIYEEIEKTPEGRNIPMYRVMGEHAIKAFEKWSESEKKVTY